MYKENLNKFILNQDQKISEALQATNMLGIAFVTADNGKLIGVITDGDIRRAGLRGRSLDSEVSHIMNKDFFYAIDETEDADILKKIPKRVHCIPVVDCEGLLIGYKFFSELTGKNALITGITGQDGAYLAEFLLAKGYTVYGAYRRTSNLTFSRLEYLEIKDKINLIPLDLTDPWSVYNALKISSPSEVYNLAAQSFVQTSFNQPQLTLNINTIGTANVLEAIRYSSPSTKYYQASTSELYGKVHEIPQNEKTPFYPRSPYAISKLAAYWLTVNYREAYGIFACNGILFNHESPIRGYEFVTRKITQGVAAIKTGRDTELHLGNLDAKRDWGYAKDYVESMWLMLQHGEPEDFVIATGKTHTVRDFAEKAFEKAGLDYREYVKVDEKFYRPTEVDLLIGDPSKAKNKLEWNPDQKTTFAELVDMMVVNDLKLLENNA